MVYEISPQAILKLDPDLGKECFEWLTYEFWVTKIHSDHSKQIYRFNTLNEALEFCRYENGQYHFCNCYFCNTYINGYINQLE